MTDKSQIFLLFSTTYYFSSLFFPPDLKEKVFTLYAYVRTADDFVDSVPQQKDAFYAFVTETWSAWERGSSKNSIISEFVALAKEHAFERAWVEAFLSAMESDLSIHTYETFEDLERYMYGSAEVIGLMMARLMKLPKEAEETARLQGKAMQLINFIRDIKEDISLGRMYIPQADLARFGITSNAIAKDMRLFTSLVTFELNRYREIQHGAEKGYHFLPYRYRVPIRTASAMYEWTADCIEKDPLIVFEKKVKPSPWFVVISLMKHLL